MSLNLSVFPPQDQLAADMYSFFSKEGDYARFFVTVSPKKRKKPCVCICGNVHSCSAVTGGNAGLGPGIFIYFSVMCFSLLVFFCSSPSLPSGLFLQLLEAQADYHRKSLTLLESVLPTIQAQQGIMRTKTTCIFTHTHPVNAKQCKIVLHIIWLLCRIFSAESFFFSLLSVLGRCVLCTLSVRHHAPTAPFGDVIVGFY